MGRFAIELSSKTVTMRSGKNMKQPGTLQNGSG